MMVVMSFIILFLFKKPATDIDTICVADLRNLAAWLEPSMNKGSEMISNVGITSKLGSILAPSIAIAPAKTWEVAIGQVADVAAEVLDVAWGVGGKNVDAFAVRSQSHRHGIEGPGGIEGRATVGGGAQRIETSGSRGARKTPIHANGGVGVGRASKHGT